MDQFLKNIFLFILLAAMHLTALFLFPMIFLTKLIVSLILSTLFWVLEEETWIQNFRSINEYFDLYSNPWTRT